jgi:cytochrome c-type biogenesis protein CcmH/NrfG
MAGNRKKKRSPYRAAIIALAVAALAVAILAAILWPLWGVHRASQDIRQNAAPRTAAPRPIVK